MTKEKQIQEWKEHREDAFDRQLYSIKRIDTLIVSLSGAAIYIVFQTLRFLHSPDGIGIDTSTSWLKYSALSSVAAIAVNFVSQILGYRANKFEAIYAQRVMDHIRKNEQDDSMTKQYDRKAKFNGKITRLSNYISAILMLIGISLLIIFNWFTF